MAAPGTLVMVGVLTCMGAFRQTVKLPVASAGLWPAMTHPVVGCMACQFDRQVYGIEIEPVQTRRRPFAVLQVARFGAKKRAEPHRVSRRPVGLSQTGLV